jgi:hypothetical protein
MSTFSKRHGYEPQDAEITIRQDAPDWLRELVVDLAYEAKFEATYLRSWLCRVLLETADRNNWSHSNVDGEVRGLLSTAPWFVVYDLIEWLYGQRCHSETAVWEMQSAQPDELANQFAAALNRAFRQKGVGWQMLDGKIEIRGPEVFEQSVREAQVTLAQTGRQVAHNEMHQALADLSKRPDPDITGAIQHSMAALECVARDVTGDGKSTLGDLLKKHPGTLPPPLDTAISKIWGFASDQGRHLRESKAPDIKEAELVVGLAGSLATYLVKKFTSK